MNDDQWHVAIEGGAAVLTVNQRLARYRVREHARWQIARGQSSWATPLIMPWQAWLIRMHDDALADGRSTRVRLPDVLQRQRWQQTVAADRTNVLLDSDAAADSARDAFATACAWRCWNDPDAYLSHDQYSWQRWCDRYQEQCAEDGVIDSNELADHLATIITEMRVSTELPGSAEIPGSDTGARRLPAGIVMDGFLSLTPQQEHLLTQLESVGVHWHQTDVTPVAQIERRVHFDDADELVQVATAIRATLESDPEQAQSRQLGVVVPDLSRRRAAVLRAFDQVFFPGLSPTAIGMIGRPYDVSLGVPLSDTALVRTAMNLIRLITSYVGGKDLSELLTSPYVPATDQEARRRERLDTVLRRRRVRRLDLAGMIRHLDESSDWCTALKTLQSNRDIRAATSSVWADRFGSWLQSALWPGDSLDSDEYQARQAWYSCLDDLQVLDDGRKLDWRAALESLQRLAREHIFQSETPATPLLIMGRLESHGVSFEQLWVTGLDSDQWPPVSSPTPFLSIDTQKSAGVPDASAALRLQQAQREFELWCARTPCIIASHVATRDDAELGPAAVIAGITATVAPVSVRAMPLETVWQSVAVEQLPDTHGSPVLEGAVVKGGARLFQDQANCPLRAYALHRLRVKPLEEAGIGLDARQHGTLLHRALECFWTEIRTQARLLEMSELELQTAIDAAIHVAIEDVGLVSALKSLEQIRLHRLLHEWIVNCETTRAPFEVQSLEEKRVIVHGGISMDVVIDRIDQVDGKAVVLDYKTGTDNPIRSWSEPRVINSQLPLYALTDEAIEAVSFAQVARHHCLFKGIGSDDSLLPGLKSEADDIDNWEGWRSHWQTALDEVAAEVRSGLASVTPTPGACQYCELGSLCRIREIDAEKAMDEDHPEGERSDQWRREDGVSRS